MDFEPLADKVVAMQDVEFVAHVPERHPLVVQSNDPQNRLSGGMYLGSRMQP